MTFNQFVKECHDREVFKMLSIYVVSSWVILQVLSVTWQPLGIPEVSVTYLILALLVGLPVYIFYIWRSRLKYTVSTDADDAMEVKNRKRFEHYFFTGYGIISFFVAMAFLLIINNSFNKELAMPEFNSEDKIAVLQFNNDTGNDKFDAVGEMAANWIQHGIDENDAGKVITQDIINDYSSVMQTKNKGFSTTDILKTYLKPSKMISGSFFQNAGNLIFRCSVVDGLMNETLISFKAIECSSDNPMDCIEDLRQKILGYLMTAGSPELIIQDSPPNYEAYQYFIDAQNNRDNDEIYLELLDKSIEADSTYFEALAFKFLYYYNKDQYKKADSLRDILLPKTGLSKRQKNLMNHYDALMKGKNLLAYSTLNNEYNQAPLDMTTNRSMMVLALQYVNKTDIIDTFFEEIPMDGIDVESCIECIFRYYIKGLADIEKKDYYKAIDLLEPLTSQSDNFYLVSPLISAYVRIQNYEVLNTLIERVKLLNEHEQWEEANLKSGKEILLLGENSELAESYFNNVISRSTDKNGKNYASAHYYKGDFKAAERLFDNLHRDDPENITYISRLIISLYKNGDTEKAKAKLIELNNLKTEYQFGAVDYALAQIFASQGENTIAIEHLMMSIASGNYYGPESFQNDYHFKDLRNLPAFNLVMNFWNK